MPTGRFRYVLLNDIPIGLSLHVAHSLMEESVSEQSKGIEHTLAQFQIAVSAMKEMNMFQEYS